MPNRSLRRGSLALSAAFLFLSGCNKPQPNAPSQDFARRHQCPIKMVESGKEGSDRMRVTGCGESEMYVRRCESRGGALPANVAHQPLSEADANLPQPSQAPFSEPGCAWARQQTMPPPPAGAAPQPKWLSEP